MHRQTQWIVHVTEIVEQQKCWLLYSGEKNSLLRSSLKDCPQAGNKVFRKLWNSKKRGQTVGCSGQLTVGIDQRVSVHQDGGTTVVRPISIGTLVPTFITPLQNEFEQCRLFCARKYVGLTFEKPIQSCSNRF